jgi:hypothetical protein
MKQNILLPYSIAHCRPKANSCASEYSAQLNPRTTLPRSSGSVLLQKSNAKYPRVEAAKDRIRNGHDRRRVSVKYATLSCKLLPKEMLPRVGAVLALEREKIALEGLLTGSLALG